MDQMEMKRKNRCVKMICFAGFGFGFGFGFVSLFTDHHLDLS